MTIQVQKFRFLLFFPRMVCNRIIQDCHKVRKSQEKLKKNDKSQEI